jgi:DNA-binding transcriptional LysR family regulator
VYQPEHLRTFLAVAETLSFSRAGERLGIGQPTVSMHIRKLELSVGRPLFIRDTRSVILTADGDTMTGFARDILAAHEHAVSHFTGSGLSGRLRFGVTDDLAITAVPRILREFRRLYPRVDLDLTVAQNDVLHRRIGTGHLDLAFAKRSSSDTQGRLVLRDRLVWAAADAFSVADQPVPLVVYQAPSLSRSLGVQALESAQQPYRIRCTARGVNGVLAAVRAGIGVAVFARTLVPSDLVEIPSLPDLGNIDLTLLTSRRAGDSAHALAETILKSARPISAP